MNQYDAVHVYDFVHPQNNLSVGINRSVASEYQFGSKFAELYKRRFPEVHSRTTHKHSLFVREMPIFSHGIADLVVVSWNNRDETGEISSIRDMIHKPTVRAFEFKLRDWRGGLMQAHRYRYFAHSSFLVLPSSRQSICESNKHLFKRLRVGLWTYDEKANVIQQIYTPRPKKQFLEKYSAIAIEKAIEAFSI